LISFFPSSLSVPSTTPNLNSIAHQKTRWPTFLPVPSSPTCVTPRPSTTAVGTQTNQAAQTREIHPAPGTTTPTPAGPARPLRAPRFLRGAVTEPAKTASSCRWGRQSITTLTKAQTRLPPESGMPAPLRPPTPTPAAPNKGPCTRAAR
jgi:hypothetical protein